MHVRFDPESVDWSAHFRQIQSGGGASYFAGNPYQRGYGIGSAFSNLFRFLLPMAQAVGKEIGREGLSVGSRVLGDLAKGDSLRRAVVNETSDGLRNLLARNDINEELHNLVNMAQSRVQKGYGSERRAIRTSRKHRSDPYNPRSIFNPKPRNFSHR